MPAGFGGTLCAWVLWVLDYVLFRECRFGHPVGSIVGELGGLFIVWSWREEEV
jgi:hypothetical protein